MRTTFRRPRGVSLAEVLIACLLLLLFMGACYTLVTRALRTFRGSDERLYLLTQVRIVSYALTKDIRGGEEIVVPRPSLISMNETPLTTSVLTLRIVQNGMIYAVSYSHDMARQSVVRSLYDYSTFNAELPETWVALESKDIGKKIELLTFTWEDRVQPQDPSIITNPALNPLSPHTVRFAMKSLDAPGYQGSGMYLWSKVRMRQ
ncbi:MAG: hypothetical protein RDV48_17175 [Candidatus Eremiobacteraeota bacterium]|nr:hypothetical protein [Candidatus Eremiobacteraeota bacterium]